MKKVYFSLVIVLLSSFTWNAIAQTSTFIYTGSSQQYTVPACTYSVNVDVQGAKGGNSVNGYTGGLGGRVQATIAVTPGQVLQVYVGGKGNNASYVNPGNAGGYNGGGQGTYYGGAGGGASDVRVSPYATANRIAVGAGGAGGAQNCYDPGASGGGTTGNNGTNCGSYSSSSCGAGGTQSAGGAGATSGGATSGTLGNGGIAAHGGYWYYGFFGSYYRYYYYSGSGGGGGYYGGGGGQYGSGGGGSSYPITGATTTYATSVTNTAGYRSGNGTVSITPNCNAPGTITNTGSSALCVGSFISLSNTTAATGPTATWVSSAPSVASVSSTGVVTGLAAGTATISYSICNVCGSVATYAVTVNAQPAPIVGASSVCAGQTTILSSTSSGGTWTSSSTAIATVGALTGTVTGVSSGTAVITYTLPAGCYVTAPIVVNAAPSSITGATAICPGLTDILSDATTGGSWSSSNALLASVGSLTGVVTGVAGGNPVITYTLSNGCYVTSVMTINAMSPITGSPSICLGSTSSLTDLTAGGVWSSSNSSIASVGSTGVVTGVAIGSANITYNSVSAGCFAVLTVYVTGTPTAYSVIGGGHFCTGGSGVTVGLSSSNSGVTYTLFNGATAIPGTILGSGFTFNFPAQTAAGSYGIIANYGSACAVTQVGTVNITIDPLPTAFTVSGGGAYCTGGSGAHVFLNSSTIGVNYQLFVNTGGGATPVGSPVPGTGVSLDFGALTTAGTYTVVGTNATTACVNNMSGSAVITINPLPTAYTVTPTTGGYCTGATGVAVGLSSSDAGVSYQLLLAGTALGLPVTGTGSSISYGLQTTPGVYTVRATNSATGCINTMTGSSTISINSLPTVYSMTGGGAYCYGGAGVAVGLNGSDAGVNYQLYNGSSYVGGPVAGTGGSISFGLQTTSGSYTVVATNATTGCVNNMFGSSSVSTNPLPTVFSMTGGGSYCNGGTGVHIGLSGSVVGTSYQLLNGATVVGGASGTGSALDFGLILPPGVYSAVGTISATGCTGTMSSVANVTVNPLPAAYSVTGGGSYCAGATGVSVGLSNSQSGVNYQLLRAGIPVGSPVSGTGSAITFGLQTAAGAYTVVATNASTSCTNIMTGSVAVVINPLPTVFNVTGGGGYCTGAPGVHVGLSGSDIGVNYQLYNGSTSVLAPVAGVGAAIDFGVIAPAGTYTVTATNPTTGCTKGMAGSATIVINALPAAYPITISSGGVYCAGGTGVSVGLGSSASGINYQLFRGLVPVGAAVPGTGSGITFGLQTVAGTYTAVGTSAVGCATNMTGSVTVSVNPLPAVYTVTGTGSYCSGGAGLPVTLSGSVVGINYQLNYAGVPLGAAQPGTGAPVVFGPVTGAGNYTITAINPVTGCSNIMAGSATISVNPLPGLFLVTGGGNYCSGATGVHVGLSGSAIGVNYQLIVGGLPSGAPLPGTTVSLDFGAQTTAGAYTVLAANTTTGCTQLMTGTVSVVINPLPALHNVTGGGSYCPGGSGVVVGLNGTNTGTNYQLFNGLTPVGSPIAGTGSAVSFGSQTATGTYSVVATNTATSCSTAMTGTATVGLFSLPTIYNVTGGGNFCPGGTGVHVGLSGTSVGINYQLFRGGTPLPGAIAGTGYAIDFGAQTTAGTYTVVATNAATGCTNVMNGNAIVNISALPAPFSVTGGGNYCAGGIGLHVGLASSATGNYYQLLNGITPVGSPMAGTGLPLDFGLQTVAGTYTVVGTGSVTGCSNAMTGSVTIVVNTLPVSYTVTGGGSYCAGGLGSDVMLSGSDAGVSYQLFAGGLPLGAALAGTGSPLDFGMQTSTGTFMVVATNIATSCTNSSTGSVAVSINPPPTPYLVTGGGVFCAGGSGVHVAVNGSDVGTQYQLMRSGLPTGAPLAGTGFGLDFGLLTTPGVYTVQATNTATTCVGLMTGSATVAASSLPAVYNVAGTGSSYCAGGTGVDVTLSGSDLGTQYQLYVGSSVSGSPVAGTGLPLDFGFKTLAGTYTVVAINTGTSCINNMSGSAAITISPLPVAFTVTGGGSYCSGGAGVNVGLSGSNVGVTYQLFSLGSPVGSVITGTGSALNFGLQTNAGTYTVVAVNAGTTCSNTMAGSATVAINGLPAAFPVVGGGNYCAGTSGVHVGIGGSALGINYQLMRGGAAVGAGVSGTGFSIDFGAQTGTGTYTVMATNPATGCNTLMPGSAIVGMNVAPAAYTVIGGGNYCSGGVGVHVGLSGSATGISYQLFNGTTMVGSAVAGIGTAIDFGYQTSGGTYTVVATNVGTSCTSVMSGSVSIVVNPLPTVYNVVGGGNYCAGGSGVHIGLSGSASGVNYQLYNGFTVSGAPVIGTGTALDLGAQTGVGTYTVIATDPATGCTHTMNGSATVGVNPLVAPAVSISTGVGDTVCSGQTITFTASAVNGGSSPSYQWTVNGVIAATGGVYSYVPLNGDVVGVTLTSNAACATPASATNTLSMTVYPSELPAVSVAAAPGTVVCQGTIVNFTATPVFGGTAPVYSWFRNNVNSGSSPTYSYMPANGDVVYCVLSSNYHCRLANNVQSSHLTMEVDNAVLPVLTIAAHPGGTLAPGETVTLVASVTQGGGTSPSYQWIINNTAVPGANSSTFTYSSFVDGDSVTCQVLSSGACPNMTGFNSVIIHVRGVGVPQINNGPVDIKLVPNPNNGTFNLKGSLGGNADEEVTFEITDLLGQVVYGNKFMALHGDVNERIQLNGSVANGMYMLNLHTQSGTKVFHVVIEQ